MTDEQPAVRALLGEWPTPVTPAPRLARALGLGPDDLVVKRDDLTGLAGGGNKIRKLEWTAGTAREAGATVLVTTGAPQSNHARLTAAAARRLGMDAVLVLAGTPAPGAGGNVALDGLLGARLVWAGEAGDEELSAAAESVADRLREAGEVPAVVPFGGSNPLGARGYALCGDELARQVPDLAHVVVAVGSGGTMAGLVHALGAERVTGVDCGAVADPVKAVADLLEGMPGGVEPRGPLRVRADLVGAGYGRLHQPVMDAMALAARTEGIVLDPVYTGRAMAGLVAEAAEGRIRPGERTVLLHSGGLPGLFGHAEFLERAAGLAAGDGQETGTP